VQDADNFQLAKSMKDGRYAWCKSCSKKYTQENKARRADYFKEYYKEQWKREEIKVKFKKYFQSPKGKEVRKKADAEQYYKTPEKLQSRHAVHYAVKSGKIPNVKTLICSVCHERQAEHYHHWRGYEKEHQLDVIPVCSVCHREVEGK
jgi:hypothetical protein